MGMHVQKGVWLWQQAMLHGCGKGRRCVDLAFDWAAHV